MLCQGLFPPRNVHFWTFKAFLPFHLFLYQLIYLPINFTCPFFVRLCVSLHSCVSHAFSPWCLSLLYLFLHWGKKTIIPLYLFEHMLPSFLCWRMKPQTLTATSPERKTNNSKKSHFHVRHWENARFTPWRPPFGPLYIIAWQSRRN